jgi:hypothetical protein
VRQFRSRVSHAATPEEFLAAVTEAFPHADP